MNEPVNSWEVSYFFFKRPYLKEKLAVAPEEFSTEELLKAISHQRRKELDAFAPHNRWIKDHKSYK